MVGYRSGNLRGEKQSMTQKVQDFLSVAYKVISKTVPGGVFQNAWSNGDIIGQSPASKATGLELDSCGCSSAMCTTWTASLL